MVGAVEQPTFKGGGHLAIKRRSPSLSKRGGRVYYIRIEVGELENPVSRNKGFVVDVFANNNGATNALLLERASLFVPPRSPIPHEEMNKAPPQRPQSDQSLHSNSNLIII